MSERKASEVFVECLEAEGVRYVFGIPGEETLDLNESLADSSIEFVPVRHEQGGAYMADAYGRLTGRAGVCLGTLGPGATNLVTAVADAFLDRAPLVALTGQSDIERMHKESHQYIDLIGIMRPIVKWNARVASPEIIPEVVRKAFAVAESEKPGATHLELPEDVMQRPLDASPLPRHAPGAARARRQGAPARRRPDRRGPQPARARRQRRDPRARGAGAARVRPQHGHPRRRDVHGQGPRRLRGSEGARHGRAPGPGLRDGRLRRGRSRDRDRLRPRRALAQALEPAARQADHRDRLDRRRDRSELRPRRRADRGHRPRAGPPRRRLLAEPDDRRHQPPARGRDGRAQRSPRRRPLPDAPAPSAVGYPRGAGTQRHPGLGRGAAQAVDRPDVPRARARHGADRQRPGGDGVRAPDRDRGQARAPGPKGGRGQRRRRLPDELPGARDRRRA